MLDNIQNELDESELLALQYQTHYCAILLAIYETNSIKQSDIVHSIYEQYDTCIPIELIDYVVSTILPHMLLIDGLIMNNKLSEEAEIIAIMYNKTIRQHKEVLH